MLTNWYIFFHVWYKFDFFPIGVFFCHSHLNKQTACSTWNCFLVFFSLVSTFLQYCNIFYTTTIFANCTPIRQPCSNLFHTFPYHFSEFFPSFLYIFQISMKLNFWSSMLLHNHFFLPSISRDCIFWKLSKLVSHWLHSKHFLLLFQTNQFCALR